MEARCDRGKASLKLVPSDCMCACLHACRPGQFLMVSSKCMRKGKREELRNPEVSKMNPICWLEYVCVVYV